MSLRRSPTIDELLGDLLVQAVMRADNVEPQALRNLLTDAAFRIAARPVERRSQSGPSAMPPIDTRPAYRGANAPMRVRPAALADPCGSAFCC